MHRDGDRSFRRAALQAVLTLAFAEIANSRCGSKRREAAAGGALPGPARKPGSRWPGWSELPTEHLEQAIFDGYQGAKQGFRICIGRWCWM